MPTSKLRHRLAIRSVFDAHGNHILVNTVTLTGYVLAAGAICVSAAFQAAAEIAARATGN